MAQSRLIHLEYYDEKAKVRLQLLDALGGSVELRSGLRHYVAGVDSRLISSLSSVTMMSRSIAQLRRSS